jgi:hypothetical protein
MYYFLITLGPSIKEPNHVFPFNLTPPPTQHSLHPSVIKRTAILHIIPVHAQIAGRFRRLRRRSTSGILALREGETQWA